MWLTSYDVDPGWGPVEADLVGQASIGERTDWAWAVLGAPIRIEDEPRTRVLLGSRHQGGSVWSDPERWPIHVYVCVPKRDSPDGIVGSFDADQVRIAYWGLLHQSRERAEVDEH
jgi:hypothetical protein